MALNTRIFIPVILLCAILNSLESQAIDGHREGFAVGLGLGYGGVENNTGYSVENSSGLTTSFKIGGGFSDQWMIYYSTRMVFFSHSHNQKNWYQGMNAAGVSYFLEPEGPSFFFSGELGVGGYNNFDNNLANGWFYDSGWGFTVGAGYEFSPHYLIEVNYMRASWNSNPEKRVSNLTVTLNWLVY